MTKYSMLIASDIHRDGLGIELYEDGNIIAEVFRSDRDKSLTFSAFKEEIPFTQIERFLQASRQRLGTFEDGTPLPPALT